MRLIHSRRVVPVEHPSLLASCTLRPPSFQWFRSNYTLKARRKTLTNRGIEAFCTRSISSSVPGTCRMIFLEACGLYHPGCDQPRSQLGRRTHLPGYHAGDRPEPGDVALVRDPPVWAARHAGNSNGACGAGRSWQKIKQCKEKQPM